MVYLWGALGGVTAVGMEWAFRAYPEISWWRLFPVVAFPALFINFAICQLVRGAGSLLDAFVVFALCTMGARVAVSVLWLPDAIPLTTWAALGLVMLARVMQVVL